MKTYKVCLDCINDLKDLRQYCEGSYKLSANNLSCNCKQMPRCFDQPERSKREDISKDVMRCSEHCGNTVRGK